MLDTTTPADSGRHRTGQTQRPGGGRVLIIVALTLSTLLSIGLFAVFGYGWYNLRTLNNGTNHLALNNVVGGSRQTADPTGDDTSGVTQNILIVGLDSRAGLSRAEQIKLRVGNDASLSTDSIMVVHVPADGSKATLISIPRDSYVDIPGGYLKNKINAAYADAYSDASGTDKQKQAAGADLLIATVKQLTGLDIDHYVQVNFGGFYSIAKAIGPIPVNLCRAVDDTYRHNQITGEGGGSGFKMTAGHHDLNAVQALEFVRQRHNLHGGDSARSKRQRYFLAQAFSKVASLGVLANPFRLRSLIKAVNGAFYIDNGFSPVALAEQMADLSGNNIKGRTIPVESQQLVSIAGVDEDVQIVDPAKVRAFAAAAIAGTLAPRHKHHKHHKHHKARGCIY